MNNFNENDLIKMLEDASNQNIISQGLSSEILNKKRTPPLKDFTEEGMWLEEPVDFVVFCESDEFLGRYRGIVPSPNQYQVAFGTLGGNRDQDFTLPKNQWEIPDPKKVFSNDRKIEWVSVVAGKGGGKDLIASYIVTYCLYILLCLRNPQFYLTGYDSEENIDIINVSQAGKQSKRVFFEHLKKRILGCKWYTDKYKIKHHGKLFQDEMRYSDVMEINIGDSSILFPKNIRAFAETSKFQVVEGYNTLMWIIDEASIFWMTKIKDVVTQEERTVREWATCEDLEFINVHAYDKETDKIVLTKANKPFYEGTGSLYEMELEDGEKIIVTPKHRFLTKEGWKRLEELKEGDEILTYQEDHKFKKIKSIKYYGEDDYYDMEVPKYHNYVAHGIVHHNSAISREGKITSSDEFFNAFKTSGVTRFGNKAFGMIISWPRGYINDFTFDKYFEAERIGDESKRNAYGFRFMTHELLPPDYYSSGVYEPYRVSLDSGSPDFGFYQQRYGISDGVLEIMVPKELLRGLENAEFESLEDFECKVLCLPPPQSGTLVRFPWAVDECIIKEDEFEYTPILGLAEDFNTLEGNKYCVKNVLGIKGLSYPYRSQPHVIFVDKSTTTNTTTVVVGYGRMEKFDDFDAEGNPFTFDSMVGVIEQIVTWVPDKNTQMMVSLMNVDEIILKFCELVTVKHIAGDQWDPSAPERFRAKGVPFEKKSVKLVDWENLISAIYAKKIRIPNHKQLIIDLKTVVREGNTVSHTDVGLSVAGWYSYFHDPTFLGSLSYKRSSPLLAYRGGIMSSPTKPRTPQGDLRPIPIPESGGRATPIRSGKPGVLRPKPLLAQR